MYLKDIHAYIILSTGGDILDAMARAVQKAVAVLVCMSSKFKESQHCRTGKNWWVIESCNMYIVRFSVIQIYLQIWKNRSSKLTVPNNVNLATVRLT